MTSEGRNLQRSGSPTVVLRRFAASDDPRYPALVYLALLTAAELLTVFVAIQIGVVAHLALLFALSYHAAYVWDRPLHRFLASLLFVPLIRVISLSLPLVGLPQFTWYFITSVPLFVSAAVLMRQLGFGLRDAGWHGRGRPVVQLLVQGGIGLLGIGLGYAEYLILRPEPLVAEFTLAAIAIPALILLISTGYLEELIFRRLMQRTAIERLGRGWGILYVALFFAVLHIGYRSWLDFFFVLVVGYLFGWLVHWTGSLVGVTIAHGLTNIGLFLIFPFLLAGGQAPLFPATGVAGPDAAAVVFTPPTPSPTATPWPTLPPPPTIDPARVAGLSDPTPTAAATMVAAMDEAAAPTLPPPPGLYAGPGEDYRRLANLAPNMRLGIVGRSADGAWLQVCCLDNERVWVQREAVAAAMDLSRLPVVAAGGEAVAGLPFWLPWIIWLLVGLGMLAVVYLIARRPRPD